jgi:exopolyphosphatase / guanosine-5'-triphosphate,3'-diphosphate pyrophosphatase
MTVRASIDIGSNSVLLLIAGLEQGKLKELSRRCEVTQLGRDLDKNKSFHSQSAADTMEVLRSYVDECAQHGVAAQAIIATATEAARVANDSTEFFAAVEEQMGLKVHVISSEAEAIFSTKGILFNTKFRSESITIMDIGGASTELIRVNTKTNQMETISMPVGSVRATQWLADDLFVQNLQKIFLDFRNTIDKFQTRELYCVAGTVTSLGNMHLKRKEFVEDDVHGLVLKSEDVDVLFKKYSDWTPQQFLEEFPFLQKRSQSIRGGLHLVYHLVHRLLVKEVTISTYGLRYGSLLEGKIKHEYLHHR